MYPPQREPVRDNPRQRVLCRADAGQGRDPEPAGLCRPESRPQPRERPVAKGPDIKDQTRSKCLAKRSEKRIRALLLDDMLLRFCSICPRQMAARLERSVVLELAGP